MWEKISRYYPPWLELLPLILFISVFNYINSNYELLPDVMPTHFGPSGMPDSWSKKSLWSVYGPLIIGLVVYVSITLTNIFLLIRPDDPRKVVNIPERNKDILGPARLEEIRAFTVKGLLVLNIIVAAMIAYLSYVATNTALGLSQGLGSLMWFFVAAIILTSSYLTIKVLLMTSTSRLKRG
jgi:uncharacterized membrane protein